jgi:hypothetical protein
MMPFQRLKFPASKRTEDVGTIPAETVADEDEAIALTAVESWRAEVVIAARGGGISRRRRWMRSSSGGGGGSRRLRGL